MHTATTFLDENFTDTAYWMIILPPNNRSERVQRLRFVYLVGLKVHLLKNEYVEAKLIIALCQKFIFLLFVKYLPH
jgi:hypothetical protein